MTDDLQIEGSDIIANDFTERAWRVIDFAREEAIKLGQAVEPELILRGLLSEDRSLLTAFLTGSNNLPAVVESSNSHKPSKQLTAVTFSPHAIDLLKTAHHKRSSMNLEKTGTEHLLIALLDSDSPAEKILRSAGLESPKVYDEVLRWARAHKRVQLARHTDRPYALDFINIIFDDFTEIYGDRKFAEDPAIVCGMAQFDDQPVLVIGQQKGRDTKQRQYRNFGMPKPEGYRKALRAMKLAEKFGRPIFTFIDTPGAYPGIDAEERGQAEAIAYNLREMSRLNVPVIITIIGEGGSGGALAIGVGDRVLMLENSTYAVITPEGCAAILWKDASYSMRASGGLRLTADELLKLKVVDQVVAEPGEGAHTDYQEAARLLKEALHRSLNSLKEISPEERLVSRYHKMRGLGVFV